MSFSRYKEYRDSGVEWLGEVPVGWGVVRVRFIADINPSKAEIQHLGKTTKVSFLPMEAIGEDGSLILDREKTIADVENGYTYFRNGDIAIAKITPCYENGKGALMSGLTNGCGFGTTELIVIRPKVLKVIGLYLQYLFISPHFRKRGESYMYGAGGQKRVPDVFISNFFITLPSLPEQTAIADFLDTETAKIDALVAEQQRLIELLKEKRQAVITHAVTKGLDPNVPMKDSGVEWLGKVPVGWEIGSLKRFVAAKEGAIKTGPFGSQLKSSDMQLGTIKVYNQRNVIDHNFSDGDDFISSEKFNQLKSFEIFPSDILVTTRGTIGRAAIFPIDAKKGILHPCLLRIQVNHSRVNNNFLKILIHDSELVRLQINILSNATTIEVIYSHTIATVVIPVPPKLEQKNIMRFIKTETAKIDTLITEATTAITLLKERRTALISAAVTGKIDVRNYTTSKSKPKAA
jgi:type I restriction enzyme, S subunit